MTGFLRILLAGCLLVAAPPAAAQTVVAGDVAEDATEAASQPKIAREGSGAVHLVFVKPVAGVDQVHLASSADGGRTWRVRPITAGDAPSRYPTLAAGPDGALHLAWTTYEPIGHIYYARMEGTRLGPAEKVSPGNAYAGVPAIAADPHGGVHLVWYGIRDQAPPVLTRHGSIYEILYSGLAGSRWSAPTVISPGIPDSINPALAADEAGVLHSAWYQFDVQAYQVRYTTRRDGDGWTLPEQVSAGAADAFAVALAVGAGGRAYLAWERRGRPARIYFAERLQRWNAQQPISPEGRNAYGPSVAVDAGGRVYVAWQSDGQIHLRRRDGEWRAVERLAAEGVNTHPIVAAAGGAVDLMWTQASGGRRQVRYLPLASSAAAATPGRPVYHAAAILLLLLAGALLGWRLRAVRR